MEAGLQVRLNAQEQVEATRELLNWQQDIKKQDLSIQNKKQVPINNTPIRNSSATQKRINSLDYRKWDTFNVEKELDHVDYQPVKETAIVDGPVIIDTQESLVQKQVGNEYFKKQRYKKAIYHYAKSFELDPTSAIPLVNKAFCHLKLKEFDQCANDCTRAIEVDSKNIKAYWRRALSRKAMDDLKGAKQDLEMALVLEPTNSQIKSDLEDIVALLDHKILKQVDKQVLIAESKPARRRLVIQEINKPIAPAAENLNHSLDSNRSSLINDVKVKGSQDSNRDVKVRELDIANNDKESKNLNDKKVKELNNSIGEMEIQELDNDSKEIVIENKEKVGLTTENTIKDNNNVPKKTVDEKLNTVEKQVVDIHVAEKQPVSDIVKSAVNIQSNQKLSVTTEKQEAVQNNETKQDSKRTFTLSKPSSFYDFERDWKMLDGKGRFELIQMFDPKELVALFKTSFDAEYLKSLLQVISDFYIPENNFDGAALLLDAITKMPRFKMVIMLLKSQEKKVLIEIFKSMPSNPGLAALYKIK